jgi:GT2 family glycosyltransferase/glycosyltransferase involved in cell wall biosynthesis
VNATNLFNEFYYETGLGVPYRRDARWLAFFARVAGTIVAEIGPATALDAGCALGMLVEQLRARGVDAQGVDISEFAIGSAHESVREHVRVGSVAEPFGRRYDLIVSIEVLEHMPRDEAERAVANFCAHSDDVLFSSSPLDYKEATHFNVNPPEYWAALFARHGLFRDVDFDASFITPWAARFRRRAEPPHRLVRDYERRFWELWKENGDLRQLAVEQRDQLNDAEARAAAAELRAGLAERRERARAEGAARELRDGLAAPAREAAELRAYVERLEGELRLKDEHIRGLEGLLRRIENGRVMRVLRAFSRVGSRGGEEGGRRGGGEAPGAPKSTPPLLFPSTPPLSDYARWIAATEPAPAELDRQRETARNTPDRPLLSVLMAVFDPPVWALRDAIASLRAQTYDRWELCVADGGSGPEVRAVLEEAAAADARVRVSFLGANRGIAANANAALGLARGTFALVLDHDDTLAPDALFEIAALLGAHPDADAVYFDEDKLSEDGAARHSPWFKPRAPSPDLLLSTNYLMHGAFRTALLRELGGFDPAADGAQDWDLALRVVERTPRVHHIARVLYHWRQVPGSAAREATAKPWAIEAQRRALEGHLARAGAVGARVEVSEQGLARVVWPTFGLKVSIIIPTKDKAGLLRACLGSILRATAYPSYEIVLVDTGSVEPATAAYYAELVAEPRVRVVEAAGPFNWGRANNVGARHASGERLLFLNNDTEALDSGWLDELVGWAERREVGVVGARLVRPDGTTQHAGIALGVEGHGSHLFDGTAGPVYGPFGSSEWYRDLLAVTGACMLVRRELFEELGGFDEGYGVGYSDIAFCLDAVGRGYRVVYTPFARLLHHEGASRGLDLPPADVLRATLRMLPLVAAGDPYWSRNLSPVSRVPAVADPAGEDTLDRLATILRHFGLVYYDGSEPLRELAAALSQSPIPQSPIPQSLFITHDLGLSGAPIVLADLAAALAARGYAVTVAAPADGPLRERLEAAGVAVRVVEHLVGDATVAYREVLGSGLVLVNTIHGARAVHAARAAGVPCVWWIHESGFGRRLADERPEVARAFAAADRVLFPAAATAALYAGLLAEGVGREAWGVSGTIVPHGVAAPAQTRDARMPDDGRFRAVLLGSVEPRKGQDTLLRALAALPQELRGQVEVELVGPTIDWAYAERVAALAALTPGARILGAVPHAEALARLAAADALVLASRDEVLPVTLLEAMAAGKAIVASTVGGVPEVLADGEEALLFAPDDYVTLAAQLARLARDPALARRLGAAARARWERDFTQEQFVNRMESILNATRNGR